MRDKKKLAIAWFGACAGCDESIVDINEELLALADAFEIVLWPVAFDYKYEQIEHLRDGELALALISGSVRNSEHEELAHLLRRKSLNLVAFGACACFGGTPGLANMVTREDIFATAYHDAPTVVNPLGIEPEPQSVIHGKELSLPVFYNEVHPLNAIIEVDYYLPGCPPPPPLISAMISAFLNGKLPQRGSTLAPDTALCEVCPRNATKPQRLVIQNLRRIHEGPVDAEQCFLAQGIVCVGPATRQGCGSPCMKVNMPCRGCFGPVEGVSDMGTAFVSSIASLLESGENGAGSVPDPAGYFYRFTTATSILGKRRSTVSRQNEGVTQWKE